MINHLKRSPLFGALLGALLTVTSAHAAQVGGIHFEEHITSGDKELLLNGAGLRTKMIFKVYAMGLYLPQRTSNPDDIISGSMPRQILLRMMRKVEGDALLAALKEGLRSNLADTELNALQPEVSELAEIFRKMGTPHEGDAIVLDFNSGRIALFKNGMPLGQMASHAMTRALLMVWLGKNPAEASLKKALLGN